MSLRKLYRVYLEKFRPLKYCKKVGVKLGKDVKFTGSMSFGSEPYLIEIGNHVLIAGATFINHEGGHHVLKGLDYEKYKDTFGYGRIIIKDYRIL